MRSNRHNEKPLIDCTIRGKLDLPRLRPTSVRPFMSWVYHAAGLIRLGHSYTTSALAPLKRRHESTDCTRLVNAK
jgi:hypothetical protein